MLDFSAAIGLRQRAAEAVLDHLVDAVDAWLPDLDTLPFHDRRLHKLQRLILDRRHKLAGSAS